MPYVRAHKIDDFNEIICLLTSNLSTFNYMVTESQTSVINRIFGSVEGPSTWFSLISHHTDSIRKINLVHKIAQTLHNLQVHYFVVKAPIHH